MSEKIVFDDFKSSFEKQNKILKITLVSTTLLLATILTLTLMNRVYFLKANMGMFTPSMPLEEVCYQATLSIAKGGKLNPHLLTPVVLNYFKNNPKDRFDIKKLYSPTLIDQSKCKVIFIDNKDQSLKGFVLKIETNNSHAFGAKIKDLDEVSATESEVK